MRYRFLIIDPDRNMCEYLTNILSDYNYECTCVYSGFDALSILEQCAFNLIIMDHKLPDIGGFHLLRQIQILHNTQIMILSSEDSEYNRVRALEEGATDFVRKPLVYPAEFLWRIQAIMKRSIKRQIILSRVQINLIQQEVLSDGKYVDLTPQLFQLLTTLASNPGKVVRRDYLLYSLNESFQSASDNILYVLIHRLRDRLEHNMDKPKLICTIRAVGYLLDDG